MLSWGWEVARRAAGAPAVAQGSTDVLRRISEMEQASANVLDVEAASRPAQAAASQPYKKPVDFALPSGGASCASIRPIEAPGTRNSSHWRDILQQVAAEPRSSTLTDSFGCDLRSPSE